MIMRQIALILFLGLTLTVGARAADDDEGQKRIFDSYLALANKGDMMAQYVVATRYETGRGTPKDLDKAFYWYEMAAKQDYPLALFKLEEREAEKKKAEAAAQAQKVQAAAPAAPVRQAAAPAPAKVAAVKPKPAAAPAAKPSPPAREKVTKQEPKPAAPLVVAKAPAVEEPARPAIDVVQALLGGRWQQKQSREDVEFLPSSRAACLQSGNTEVICFSPELTHNVNDAGLTYNVKSVISRMDNKEAKFSVRYVYNVVDVAGRPHANTNGMPNEANDVNPKTGWQEPGIGMECQLRDERLLACTRADRKTAYLFVRE